MGLGSLWTPIRKKIEFLNKKKVHKYKILR